MLNISSLGLKSLKEVNIPEDITKLYYSYNKIETLEGIEKCNKLTILDCSYNGLRELKYCPESIEYIFYDNNPIKEEYRGRDIGEIHSINKEKWERSIYKEVMKEDNFSIEKK